MDILPMALSPGNFQYSADLHPIKVNFKTELDDGEEKLLPYLRDEKLVRPGPFPERRDWSTALADWKNRILPVT